MKLFYSATSPFVRKVMIVAHEVGCSDAIVKLECAAHPVRRDQGILRHNPLGQVPTMVLDDETVLADSRVIAEYLDTTFDGGLLPAGVAARWRALSDQSLCDGALSAAILARYETAVRPEEVQWHPWVDAQLEKARSLLADLERRAGDLDGRFDIGTISIACVLAYLDMRFGRLDWRRTHPATARWFAAFDERPSLAATRLLPPPA